MIHIKNKIVLHHTAIAHDGKPQFDRVLRSHNARWHDHGVAYHRLIEEDSTVKIGRGDWHVGYHAGVWEMNLTGIGISLAGDFTQHDPTRAQLQALTRTLLDVQIQWRIPMDRVFLHRELKATACPGQDLRQIIQDNGMYAEAVARKKDQLIHARKRASDKRKKEIDRVLLWLENNA